MPLLGRLLALLTGSGLALATVVAIAVAMLPNPGAPVALTSAELPDLTPLPARSVVLAADGSTLAVLYDENRALVPLAEVPRVLLDAVIATEDKNFYEHEGIDVRAMSRALMANAKKGEVDQGGSTITQQLVKNALLDSERTLGRKVEEAQLALQLEDELGKDGILERYLNTVYLGQSTYGVRAAAERYFGKAVAQLELHEAALIAGLIASPESFDPFADPAAAQQRRQHVLGRMVAEGTVNQAPADAASAVPLPTAPHSIEPPTQGYFVEEVKRLLLQDPRLGGTPQARYDAMFRGGLVIRTTLDPIAQRAAEQAVAAHLPASPFHAALVAIDPRTGGVRALVGGPGLDRLRFNLATQGGRQAGSTFKVVTLAAALEDGHSPEDLVDGTAPCTLALPPPAEPWNVANYDEGSGSVVTLREATVQSLNCAYARAALAIGPARVADMAERLGIGRKLAAVPSITLGTQEVSPLEMATVFATLAAEGVRTDPYLVTEVTDGKGQVLLRAEPNPRQVIDREIARTVTSVLEGVIASGTGTAAAIGRPAAGKTGTSQEWRDAWFGGFTPGLAATVWMGSPEGQVSMRNVGGRNVTGGSYPARIWGAFMAGAVAGHPPTAFTAPDASRWPQPKQLGELPPGFVPPWATPPPPPPPGPAPAPGPEPKAPTGDSGGSGGGDSGGGKKPRRG